MFLFDFTGASPTADQPRDTYPVVVHPLSEPARSVLVVQDYYYGKYLGYLKVKFDDRGRVTEWSGNPILLDKSVQKDPQTEQELARMKRAVDKLAEVRIIIIIIVIIIIIIIIIIIAIAMAIAITIAITITIAIAIAIVIVIVIAIIKI